MCTVLLRVRGGLGCVRTLWTTVITSMARVLRDVFCVKTTESSKLLAVQGLLCNTPLWGRADMEQGCAKAQCQLDGEGVAA